jgi:peptidoglycan/LPS O-acetylase OafA/YrhL
LGSGRTTIDYRPDIDGLRAIAVGCVVIFHAFPRWMPGGFVGVDVFFVISGFLISGIILRNLANESFTFAGFYAGRIRRILPSLVLTLAATWALGWFVLSSADYETLGRHILAASTFVSNFILGQEQGYFAASATSKPLLHLWSLAIEEQFYLIWPATLYLIWRLRLSPTPILLGLIVISFGWSVTASLERSVWSFYSPQTRLWELAIGALLACGMTPAAELRDRYRLGNLLALAGLVSIGVSTFGFDATSPYPSWRAMLPVGGAALLVLAGPGAWINQRMLSRDGVVLVGLISYPLYLFHWPLLSFASVAAGGEPSAIVRCAIVTASFAAAWASYQFVEKPIRFRNYSGMAGRRYVPATLVACLCAMGVVGLFTERTDGFVGRFPEAIRHLANYKFDVAAYRQRCLILLDADQRAFDTCVDDDWATRPLLMLWGDSHAAHLYPGLKEIQQDAGFSLAQFTAGACPPAAIEVSVRVACPQINEFVLGKIKELRPSVVIMAASWWSYPQAQYEALSASISKVKEAGIEGIWIVGPVPAWNPSLPSRLVEFYQSSVPKRIPYRMQGAAKFTEIEQILRGKAARFDVGFISATEVMCNMEGCLTRTGEGPEHVVAWDEAHLTKAGSRVLADKIYARVLPTLMAGTSRPDRGPTDIALTK